MLGRLCKDVELVSTSNGTSIVKNTLAIPRSFVKQGEERKSDFINLLIFGKTAEFVSKYFKKGDKILIEDGSWQTGDYEKEGKKIYTNELLVHRVDFVEGRNNNTEINNQERKPDEQPVGNFGLVDDVNEVLPF